MKMLFLRDFHRLTGGHLKYRDYLNHTLARTDIEPELFLTPESSQDRHSNPFLSVAAPILPTLQTSESYFVAGTDWALLDAAGIDTSGKPVVNLIQHVAHADPTNPRFAYLDRPALRICVSAEVERALSATRRVKGEMVIIENAVDLDELGTLPNASPRSGLFIAGYKSPEKARALAERLNGAVAIDLADSFLPRKDFLLRMARARLCALLPDAREGFYLPALEAMALGAPLIVPDCVGNRSFCRHLQNCLMPAYTVEALADAVFSALSDRPALKARAMRARETAARHSLAREREQYFAHLDAYLSAGRFS